MDIYADFDDDNEFTAVFSGYGCIASRKELVNKEIENFGHHLLFLVQLRTYLSTTGAMRWPWSQEAPINIEHEIYV